MKIRSLLKSDKKDWHRLWTAYLQFYETSVSEHIYDTAFSRLLSDNSEEFNGLIVEKDGSKVGLAHYLFHRKLWTIEDTCYLMDLFVEENFRGQGLGQALIEKVKLKASEAGISNIYWMTQEFNYKGRMLYDKVAERTPFIVYQIQKPN